MKKVINGFTIAAIVLDIIISIVEFFKSFALLSEVSNAGAFIVTVVLILIVINAIVIGIGVKTMKSVDNNDKKIWVGILNFLFVSRIAGIVYLCWDGTSD